MSSLNAEHLGRSGGLVLQHVGVDGQVILTSEWPSRSLTALMGAGPTGPTVAAARCRAGPAPGRDATRWQAMMGPRRGATLIQRVATAQRRTRAIHCAYREGPGPRSPRRGGDCGDTLTQAAKEGISKAPASGHDGP
jgi:hypothetical protein